MSTRFFTKILLALGFLACTATAAYAVKAYPYPIKVTQPDGSTITIQVHGDEFLNWTTAGNRLVEKAKASRETGFPPPLPLLQHRLPAIRYVLPRQR